jgi:transglutaminase-like putative cysteine protease
MKWEIKHLTRYDYASAVKESFNEVRLTPVNSEHQRVESFLLKVLPATRLRHYTDFYSNVVHHFEIAELHSALAIESNSIVDTRPPPALPAEATPAPLAALKEAVQERGCFDFLQASRFVDVEPQTWRLAVDATMGLTDAWQQSLAIMRFVHQRLVYQPHATHVHTHMREVLEQGRGVCQDFAHVMLGLCRCVKIPAVYVSGYLATETANATHAWVEVFIPGIGWRGLDPTHNNQIDETYIKLSTGRDYHDVSPVTGYYKGTMERKMQVEVKIRPLNHG